MRGRDGKLPSAETVEAYRKMYPEGTKLRLTSNIDDPYTPKESGDIFTVSFVDDIGELHGSFASGGSLALIPEIDSFEVVS